MIIAVKIQTTNDSNGNPRRGWLVYNNNKLTGFVDEGYEGNLALRNAAPKAVELFPPLNVQPAEYNKTVATAKTAGAINTGSELA